MRTFRRIQRRIQTLTANVSFYHARTQHHFLFSHGAFFFPQNFNEVFLIASCIFLTEQQLREVQDYPARERHLSLHSPRVICTY